MKGIQGKSILVRVGARFELARVAVSVLFGDNSRYPYVSAYHKLKYCNFFIFGDRLRHVFKPLLLYFDLCNADTSSTGYMQQPYCASLGSRFLQVRDNQI